MLEAICIKDTDLCFEDSALISFFSMGGKLGVDSYFFHYQESIFTDKEKLRKETFCTILLEHSFLIYPL